MTNPSKIPPYLFMRVKSLLLKAEALYLVEIQTGIKRNHIVSGYSRHRFVRGVLSSVEGQGCLSWDYFDLLLVRLELP